jgi:outer membrane protein OmpA-like peptidoglycan-associated protein
MLTAGGNSHAERSGVSRNQLIGRISVVALLLVAAVFALRFDLLSFLPAGEPRVTEPARAMTAPRFEKAPARIADTASLPDASGRAFTAAPNATFDVVTIDPDGASVFAGKAPPNANVTVLANERPIASATANESGDWVIVTERPFTAGDHQISVTAKPAQAGSALQGQSVQITIASKPRTRLASAKTDLAPPVRTPTPIRFVYDKATFTEEGRKSASGLVDYLRTQQLASVTLSGHADERGSDRYNMDLSRRRLDAVMQFLRENGVAGKLVLLPKGKREPYSEIDRRGLPKEHIYQLDRRVELQPAR